MRSGILLRVNLLNKYGRFDGISTETISDADARYLYQLAIDKQQGDTLALPRWHTLLLKQFFQLDMVKFARRPNLLAALPKTDSDLILFEAIQA